MEELFGRMNIKVGFELCDEEYRVITVHSEWNFIFLIEKDRTLIAYDMNRRKVHVIHTRVIRFCRSRGRFYMNKPYYLSYVPLLIESFSIAVKVHFLHFVIMTVFVQVSSCFHSMYIEVNFGLLTKGMVCSILLIMLLCSGCGSEMKKRGSMVHWLSI
jgi:hypothetical protein